MKKILVLTSRGGRGHISVTEALTQSFGDQYEIEPYFVFTELLRTFDLTTFFTCGRLTGEDFYNLLLRHKLFFLINIYYMCGRFYFGARRTFLKKIFVKFLSTKKPDLVLSVVPLINGALLEAAQQLNMPFIVLPTDLDSSSFIAGIKDPSYEKSFYCIPFDDSNIRKTIEPAGIPVTLIKPIGFPVRNAFLEHKDIPVLKKRYAVSADKPVILLMLGGIGSHEIIIFVKKLCAVTLPMHLMVCIGTSKHLKALLQSIALPKNITMTIIDFSDRVSDLMAIATLIITKSGSVTISESLYMELPLLLDATSAVIAWEQFNHYFIQKHHLGLIINNYAEVSLMVTRLLNNPLLLEEIKKNIQRLNKRHASKEIASIFDQLLNNKARRIGTHRANPS